ncbi:MAG: hypothetical protein V4438_01560 [Patescibacteria group bacterium]
MALKNHTIDSSKVSEEQIEAIIADRIKYDPKNQKVVLLPNARTLSNDRKILLYLVALKGWKFLIEKETPHEDASPLEITHATGIPGGSVRPILRGLEDRKIIITHKGRYEVPSHNLSTIQSLLSKQDPIGPVVTKHSKAESKSNSVKNAKAKRVSSNSNKPSLAEGFAILMEKKWFKGGKTTNQLKDKLDEMTIFPPIEQLPSHLLNAYRKGNLVRSKQNTDGKKIWVYEQR